MIATTQALLRRLAVLSTTASASLLACGSSDDSELSGGGSFTGDNPECSSLNWRSPTASSVACPGAPGCTCGAGTTCCVTFTGGSITAASCTPLAQCRDLAFLCDGPEDCPAGTECCGLFAPGGGSSCVPSGDCGTSDEKVFCREQGDCDGLDTCVPAESPSYYSGIAARCD